jgi:oligoendopeptidase F
MSRNKIITRDQQHIEDTWNMQDLYANENLYDADVKKLEQMMEEFAALQGSLGQGAQQLLKALSLYEEMSFVFEKLYVYSNQKYHEDTANARYQKMSGEAQILSARLGQVSAWFDPELLALPQEMLDGYFEELPELAVYRRFTDQITRVRSHVLDAEQEALMARIGELGQAPFNIFSMFNNADVRFPKIAGEDGEEFELTSGNYVSCLESRDRTLRKAAFEAMYSVYGQFTNTLAAVYYANAKQADFFAKEHHYANAMESALDASSIPVSVYIGLVDTINAHMPLMHRYVSLRKKMLGLEELHLYDVYVPLADCPEQEYTFEEAKEIVLRGLAPLGEDYQALLREGFENRWIDVYENKGKRTGAYSWGVYGTHPYVLLNYNGTLNNVFTLAHEMGHAIHSWYSDHAQRYLDAGYRIFVAEVASTCNEALLIHDLMERCTDREEKKYLINYFLDQFKGTMFRQTMFAEFELVTHGMVERGEMLTAETLGKVSLDLNRRYFGEEMYCDSEIAYEWSRIPHYYTPFYVYQYATGFAAAIAISSKILNGEPGIVEKYKQFLSGGCSQDPIDLLKICGVDIASPQPIEEAIKVFEEYLNILETM